MAPLGNLRFVAISGCLFFRGIFTVFSFLLGGGFLNLFDDGLLVALSRHLESGDLLFVLEANYTDDLADATLNGEELIHESELEAHLFGLKLVVVAETFQKDVTLVRPVLGDLLLHEFHHKGGVEVDGGVLLLLEGVHGLGNGAEVKTLLSPRVREGASELSLSTDLVLDQLVDGDVHHVVFDGEV